MAVSLDGAVPRDVAVAGDSGGLAAGKAISRVVMPALDSSPDRAAFAEQRLAPDRGDSLPGQYP